MAAAALWLFQWRYGASITRGGAGAQSLAEAQTMAMTAVITFQAFYMLECRSLRDSIFHIGVFSNPVAFIGIGVTLALQATLVYPNVA
jgi:Ca2+-transporting ATPase